MATPSVLLLDDGELDDVRSLLDGIGAQYVHLRGGAIPEQLDPPRDVFIASSRRAVMAKAWIDPQAATTGPVKIAVVTEDSNTLRGMLRRIGFDMLVRRPVHPYALRLLLLRSLYHGEERRRETRVPVGCEVSYRSGLRRRTAVLADISQRGCRLLSSRLLDVGTRIAIQLPKEIAGGRPLALRCRVIRAMDGGHGARRGEYTIGMVFEGVTPGLRKQITQILASQSDGPATLTKELGTSPPSAGAESTPAAAPASSERRKHKRGLYNQEVVQLGDEASSVLVGRDLSVGGMLVDGQDLEPGRKLRLALYGAPREEPFVLSARVLRITDEGFAAIQFDSVPAAVEKRLEALVARLPSVESLEDDEAAAMGSIVSQIIGDDE